MARYRLKRYLGIVFIGVVIAPAVILSFLAIRAISHEEAYIEKQIEGTLAAEVDHVSAIVKIELAEVQVELEGTIVMPGDRDLSRPFALWKQRSELVEIPFLLSPDYEILWPIAGPGTDEDRPVSEAAASVDALAEVTGRTGGEKESAFLQEQQAFLTDEEKTPVYENIAAAYKNDILDEAPLPGATEDLVRYAGPHPRAEGESARSPSAERFQLEVTGEAESSGVAAPRLYAAEDDLVEAESTPSEQQAGTGGDFRQPVERASLEPETRANEREETRRQSAISQFLQSESVRKKVYDKAEREGQEVLYRNIKAAEALESKERAKQADTEIGPLTEPMPRATFEDETSEMVKDADAGREISEDLGQPPVVVDRVTAGDSRPTPAPSEGVPEPEAIGKIRSIFISEPLSFSEIVAGGRSGIIPRMTDGRLELLYWQRAADGKIVGCLIDSRELRERIIGALPGIYSAVRILTILDEVGQPLIVPPGHDGRDWQRPFVAEEISETLPRWEVAAYLTDPDVISSRAQVATSVMWILILILFVSIAAGGLLIVRSTYAEMRLAQQKTTFVANVSHELKTPLTSIRMFAEMLRDGHQPDQEKQKKYLDIMTAETERLTRLVNNVLDFSRMERGEKRYTMKTVDLAALCSGVIESQRTRLENNGFEVAFTTRTGMVPVNADEEAIKQALINLLSNAEKYSTDTRQIAVDVRREAASAVVSVSDRGVGIPADDAERIFDEFYRVDDTLTSKVKGAGLGLTIAGRILEEHGGRIRYRNREGGGSTFELVLPLTEDKA